MTASSGPGTARRVVARYPNYRDAERAVDHLSDNKFPVEHVSIVGRGLKLVEHVTGRMGWGRSALGGALTGAMVGFLVGWLFAVFDWFDPAIARGWLIIDGIWFGALVGATMGLLTYALTGGRRDFASIGAMEADEYCVVVDDEYADQAMQLVSQMGASAGTSASTAPTQGRT